MEEAAIMAPTGVLAEQHYRNFQRFLEGIGAEMSEYPNIMNAAIMSGTKLFVISFLSNVILHSPEE